MRPPRYVTVRGIKLSIKPVREIDPLECDGVEGDDTVLGSWSFWGEEIELVRLLPRSRMRVNLLHELLHEMTQGFKLSEDQIESLAFDLYDTLKRSRRLRRYLFGWHRRRWF